MQLCYLSPYLFWRNPQRLFHTEPPTGMLLQHSDCAPSQGGGCPRPAIEGPNKKERPDASPAFASALRAKGADAPARRLRGQQKERGCLSGAASALRALSLPHLPNPSSPRGRRAYHVSISLRNERPCASSAKPRWPARVWPISAKLSRTPSAAGRRPGPNASTGTFSRV